ncbi:MAG: LuxR C-terminal-related transcriptional regulator, partial [Phycisphaerae bacterium]
ASADEALRIAARKNPDIILMDIDMPGLSCFEAARSLSIQQPELRIIFLSAFLHDKYIEQALEAQAHGYITKREPPEQVVAAIREVVSGGAYFSSEVQSRIVVDSSGAKLRHESRSRASTLSRRELEVLRYIARGAGKKQIASITHLSVKTVEHHTTRLMAKLDIHDRVELTRFAIREGLAET